MAVCALCGYNKLYCGCGPPEPGKKKKKPRRGPAKEEKKDE